MRFPFILFVFFFTRHWNLYVPSSALPVLWHVPANKMTRQGELEEEGRISPNQDVHRDCGLYRGGLGPSFELNPGLDGRTSHMHLTKQEFLGRLFWWSPLPTLSSVYLTTTVVTTPVGRSGRGTHTKE